VSGLTQGAWHAADASLSAIGMLVCAGMTSCWKYLRFVMHHHVNQVNIVTVPRLQVEREVLLPAPPQVCALAGRADCGAVARPAGLHGVEGVGPDAAGGARYARQAGLCMQLHLIIISPIQAIASMPWALR
jgi:hypothetical protein